MKFDQLVQNIQGIDESLKLHLGRSANVALTIRNWLIGAYIVEFEQEGEERAEYGKGLLSNLSKELNIKGLSHRNLGASRLLYQEYPQISQTLSAEFKPLLSSIASAFPKYLNDIRLAISQAPSAILGNAENEPLQFNNRPPYAIPIHQIVMGIPFSSLVELMRIEDPDKRVFYEIEMLNEGWNGRELKRQIGTLLYERMGLSTDKDKLLRIANENARALQPIDVIKDPYMFEFLGLTPGVYSPRIYQF